MLGTPKILGFSMASRRNRRLLVASTYALLLACLTAIMIVLGARAGTEWAFVSCLVLTYNVVSMGVFGKVARPTSLPPRGGEITSLGLAAPSSRDRPDEREVAIRNAAYYEAYRVLMIYGFVFFGVVFGLSGWRALRGSIAVLLLQALCIPLLTMLFTLPQAIILWTEPDVPEEAMV